MVRLVAVATFFKEIAMNAENAEKVKGWFKKHDLEFPEFERIPESDRLHEDQKICGLMKLLELSVGPPYGSATTDMSVDAENRVICLTYQNCEDLRDDITEYDVIYLLRCGIYWHSNDYLVWSSS
jgi:hypothetical protein